jgi:hypothetical protein
MLLLRSAALLAALAAPAVAQLSSGGLPATQWADLAPTQAREILVAPDVEALRARDRAQKGGPLRYGETLPVDIGVDRGGSWDRTADGSLVWRARFEAAGALSLGIEFSEFALEPGVQVFVYDPGFQQVLGAYTDFNHQPNRQLLVEPLAGDVAVVEAVFPAGTLDGSRLRVGKVIYDYLGVLDILAGEGGDPGGYTGGCDLIDINCAQGQPWQTEKRAVVRTLSNNALCSGALINNTSQDQAPLIYTADHCGQTENCVFLFGYERPNCGSGNAPSNQTLSGCQVLNTSPNYDNRLLLANNAVPLSFEPYFIGWSRAKANFNQAVAISHPGGGPKKIAEDSNGATLQPTRWFVDWTSSYVLGGSSGGPLIDQNGRVRGSACCVNTLESFGLCSQTAWYGRLDQFYLTTTANEHLDPLNLIPLTLDGFDPLDPDGGDGNPFGGINPGPSISNVTPDSAPAVIPNSIVEITLQGDGFTNLTSLTVGGVELTVIPPQFLLEGDSQVRIFWTPNGEPGPIDIVLTDNLGSDTATVLLELNDTPTLDLANSSPAFILSAIGLQSRVGAQPGDVVFLQGSVSNVPSTLPGLVSLDLGNNFSELVDLGSLLIVPPSGVIEVTTPLPGGLTGLNVYVQAAVVAAPDYLLPAAVTNLETGTILF